MIISSFDMVCLQMSSSNYVQPFSTLGGSTGLRINTASLQLNELEANRFIIASYGVFCYQLAIRQIRQFFVLGLALKESS